MEHKSISVNSKNADSFEPKFKQILNRTITEPEKIFLLKKTKKYTKTVFIDDLVKGEKKWKIAFKGLNNFAICIDGFGIILTKEYTGGNFDITAELQHQIYKKGNPKKSDFLCSKFQSCCVLPN